MRVLGGLLLIIQDIMQSIMLLSKQTTTFIVSSNESFKLPEAIRANQYGMERKVLH